MAKIRQATNHIAMLKKGDEVLCNKTDIENHVLDFFSNLYASENSCNDNGLVDKVIPPMVSMEDNLMLTNLLSFEEVKAAVFGMNGAGSPGSDGFGGRFFQAYWNIVGKDVHNPALQFFK